MWPNLPLDCTDCYRDVDDDGDGNDDDDDDNGDDDHHDKDGCGGSVDEDEKCPVTTEVNTLIEESDLIDSKCWKALRGSESIGDGVEMPAMPIRNAIDATAPVTHHLEKQTSEGMCAQAACRKSRAAPRVCTLRNSRILAERGAFSTLSTARVLWQYIRPVRPADEH